MNFTPCFAHRTAVDAQDQLEAPMQKRDRDIDEAEHQNGSEGLLLDGAVDDASLQLDFSSRPLTTAD